MVFTKEQLVELVKTYSIATNIGCKAFKINGDIIYKYPEINCRLCELVKKFKKGEEDCRQSAVYGGLQAERWGEAYIYFCPYGLVNWAAPVVQDNELKYFLTGGPVLMHEVDNLLIEDIIQQNPLLKDSAEEIREYLSEMEVVDTLRVRYLASLLLKMASSLMVEHAVTIKKRREITVFNARLAETIHALKNGEEIGLDGIYPFEKENELISLVKLGDKEGAREVLNKILGFIYFKSGNKFELVKSKAIELMVVLARAAIEVGADLEIIFGLEYTYLENINEVRDINKLSEWLTKVLDRFIECTFSIKNVKNKDIIYKAMDYIRRNFNKDIRLNEVASNAGLSPAYFSKLFKEEMGISYSDYLNRVRIEASKQILRENLPLAEIAQMVGFNDQSYFSRVFKRIEGITPGRWRTGDNKRA